MCRNFSFLLSLVPVYLSLTPHVHLMQLHHALAELCDRHGSMMIAVSTRNVSKASKTVCLGLFWHLAIFSLLQLVDEQCGNRYFVAVLSLFCVCTFWVVHVSRRKPYLASQTSKVKWYNKQQKIGFLYNKAITKPRT